MQLLDVCWISLNPEAHQRPHLLSMTVNKTWQISASTEIQTFRSLLESSCWCGWEDSTHVCYMLWCSQVGQRCSLGWSSVGSLVGWICHRLRLHARVLEQGSAGAFPPGDRQCFAPNVWEVLRQRLGISVPAQSPAHQLRGPAHWQSGLHDTRLVKALGGSAIQTIAQADQVNVFSIWAYVHDSFSWISSFSLADATVYMTYFSPANYRDIFWASEQSTALLL